MKKASTLWFLGALIVSSFLLSKSFLRHEPIVKSNENAQGTITRFDPVKERNRWMTRIDKIGAEAAYAEFKTVYLAHSDPNVQHLAAHLMGEILYEKKGADGLTACDSTFAFGCYHSFFGQALARESLGIVSQFDAACVKKYGPRGTGCQHGIGHGIMEYFGHEKLLEALEACGKTTQEHPLHGCTSGVFMEYNVPILLQDQTASIEPRPLDPKDPFFPCETLPLKFQSSCYYEMGQWWDKVYNHDYQKLGELCNTLKNHDNWESCYLGIGNVAAPSSKYDVKETVRKCTEMPTASGRETCLGGATWSFTGEPTKRHLAIEVCRHLSPESQKHCAQLGDMFKEL